MRVTGPPINLSDMTLEGQLQVSIQQPQQEIHGNQANLVEVRDLPPKKQKKKGLLNRSYLLSDCMQWSG